MRSRKLLALLFCLITFPAIAGYMTLLGAGVGNISPTVSWVAGTDTFPDTSLTYSGPSLSTMFDSTGKLTYKPNNLIIQSANFSNVAWSTITATVSGGVSDPVGGTGAYTVTAGGVNSQIYQIAAGSGAGTNTLVAFWMRRRTGTGTIQIWDMSGSATTVTGQVSGSWALVYARSVTTGGARFAGINIVTSGDAIDIFQATASAVTYETSPRPGDQVITTASAYYGPRIDYDPNTLAVKGLLVEEARTNLAIQSEALSGASWAAGGSTKSTDGTLYLNGSTANKITATAINNNHSISSALGVSVTSGQAYTQSFFVKAGTHSKVAVSSGAAANWSVAVFDISGTSSGVATQTGAGSDTAVSGVSTYLGGGWFRLALTFTASATGSRFLECQMVSATTGNTFGSYGEVIWLAAGTENFYVGQPQLESGSFATSYIPTAAASVTRVAETVQLTGSALAVMQGASGTAFVQTTDMATNSSTSQTLLGLANGGTMGYPLFYWPANTKITTVNASVTLSTAVTPTLTSPVRAGIAWSAAGRSIANNGGTVATDANPFSSAAVTGAYLGVGNGGALYWLNGHIASAAFYNSRLPDATLQAKSVVGASYAANDNGIRYAFADNDNLPIHWRVAL